MTEPIPFRVTRYRCPTCPRTGSSKARITEHIGRCWTSPEARGCKTCKHLRVDIDHGEACIAGIDLSGQKPCPTCFGLNDPWSGPCADPAHVGNGIEIKPGPIVHCHLWEIDSTRQGES